ncbi:3-oxoacyl-ACP reductase FabG [Anaerobiospirillum sp. NML120449]|uniref:3-oxoacyl-ACP reductase FabG n=1 Tax=Anaerobiospirillum sp. NML120449 TaxID=2932817 RepID=UPI001FF5B261|nr:3-oxoacyl-ACP reductase FabG [Anaerobiospirillum sp. NML120449]MCK0525968.1 3-oxoacyl-ACP reductase FabG [Anaerobiospirillum sp. NML120449]
MNFNFAGKVVLVTGASRGIGKTVAEEFAKLNATVIGTATSESGAQAVTESLSALGEGKSFGMVLNALQPETFADFVKAAEEKAGATIDILVNNAGITRDNLFMRMKDEEWDQVISCNLTAAAKLAQLTMRGMMKKRNGRIINITSIVGETGNAGQCNYAASKAGIIGFSKSLAKELAPRNVTVNCVAPGFIETDMTSVLNENIQAELLKSIPMGTMGSTADIAAAVLFLASDGARYITGTTLDVNGGMYCN